MLEDFKLLQRLLRRWCTCMPSSWRRGSADNVHVWPNPCTVADHPYIPSQSNIFYLIFLLYIPITDIQFLTFSYFYIRHLLFIIFHFFLILNICHLYASDFLFFVPPQFSSYPFKYMPPIMFLSGFFFCLSVSHSLSIAVSYGQFVLVLIFYFY